jgi:hypothetical protein
MSFGWSLPICCRRCVREFEAWWTQNGATLPDAIVEINAAYTQPRNYTARDDEITELGYATDSDF